MNITEVADTILVSSYKGFQRNFGIKLQRLSTQFEYLTIKVVNTILVSSYKGCQRNLSIQLQRLSTQF